WPPASSAISSCSTTSSWPTTVRATAALSASRRSRRAARLASSRAMAFMGSSVECVHHDVDGEAGVVFREPALVAPVVVPFAAVVLVAVEHAEPALVLDAFQVVVHQVVAPAVQLEAGGRRAVELEEAGVERMRAGQLGERVRPEDGGHLGLEAA